MSFLSELVQEINKVRSNPSSYADIIDSYKQHFQGKILRLPNSNVGIKTQEGADGYDECARFLRSAEPAEPQIPSKGLTKIANELLVVVQRDPSEINTVDMNSIIDKYGSFVGSFNRVMECGGATPEQVVINLLVSDGDRSRSQRDALLNKSLKRVGVASGKHDIYRVATVIIFCTKFENSVDSDDSEYYGADSSAYSSGYSGGYSDNSYTSSSQTKYKYEEPKPEPKPEYQPQPQYQYQQEPQQPKYQYQQEPQQPKYQYQYQQEPQQPKYQEGPESFQKGGLTTLNDKIVPKQNQDYSEDPEVVSVDKSERVVVEGGRKKKKVTYTKHYRDGHTEKEVKFEPL